MRLGKMKLEPVPLALFVVVVLGYGIYIPWFGLYGDDWIYLWAYHLQGPLFFIDFVAIDRPFSAWIYILTSALFGENVWAYHALLLLLRWLSAVVLWWVFRMVWPKQIRPLTWVAVFFALYPGFQQQPISIQFILHFSALVLFLLSLGWMIRAVQHPQRRRLLTLEALLSQAISLFSVEYFFGLEFLRPVLLWMTIKEQAGEPRRRIRLTLLQWLPYLAVLGVYLYWRIFVFEFPTYQPRLLEGFMAEPFRAVLLFTLRVLRDFRLVTYGAWRQVFSLPEESRYILPGVLLVLISAVLIVLFMLNFQKSRQQDEDETALHWKDWPVQGLLLGGWALLMGAAPIWIAEVPLELVFPWDRSTLSFMFGVSFLTVALVYLLVRQPFRVYLLGALAALAIGFHFQNAIEYRNEQEKLRSFYWQLAWRAPGLKPGTILVFQDLPLNRVGDNSMTPALNWTYAPELRSRDILYKVFDLNIRLGTPWMPDAVEGQTVRHTYREIAFEGSTSNLLAVDYHPPACLHLLGPEGVTLPGIPAMLASVLPISKLDLVITDAEPSAQPPAAVGPEPEREWCYYYEKADLARQKQDWQEIVRLGDEAWAEGINPGNKVELLPFIEGYARVRDWDLASQLSALALEQPSMQEALCATWTRIHSSMLDSKDQEVIEVIQKELNCIT